ncbi:hypothetical protein ACIP4T_14830 [Streptomyces massasporeus]|uniref:hypothetical protein n=1 Tax=Streptomyces massasporeus TaxID=67324 RepID=UPI0036ED7D92
MGADGDKPKVDNPDRVRLQKLKQELEKERGELVSSLKKAAAEIGKGGRDSVRSWVGKNADKWHDDVAGHRKTVRTRIDKVLEDIQREIDRMPEKVTPEEANSMNRSRHMY